MSSSTYSKRAGTSGIRGQLYETKLLALLYFRATHTDSIEEFHLATNVDDIGAFDDVCFRAKVKGINKPIAVFIQAKHSPDCGYEMAKYFDSYMRIRNRFNVKSSNEDPIFEGNFDETNCLFVMYTIAKGNFENVSVKREINDDINLLAEQMAKLDINKEFDDVTPSSLLNDLIGTGGTVTQPYKNADHVNFLRKIALKEQITSLAVRMAKVVLDDGKKNTSNFQNLLNDEFISRYHVILAQNVIEVSEINPKGHRVAAFTKELFNTNEEFLMTFRDALSMEVLKLRKLESDAKTLLLDFFKQPSDVTKLSKLIGTELVYNNNKLEFVKKPTEDLKFKLDEVQLHVTSTIVKKATELAAKSILIRKFDVPAAFGNKDLTIGGNDAKIEKRLNHLTARICDIIDKSKTSDVITLDDTLENGLQQINGGIGGAIGNLLVLDENPKLMKFTDSCDQLGDLAKRLHHKLASKIENLNKYKFCINVTKFPKLLFDCSNYVEDLHKDFLNKLFFYTNQSNEEGVGDILKKEIEIDQRNRENYFQVRTDALFLKYHDEIQQWWMLTKQASYLTKESNIFENAINRIVKDPLMGIINVIYMNKIKHAIYKFNKDAMRSLNFNDRASCTVIITEHTALTITKVMQILNNKDYIVLDLVYIMNLPINDRLTLQSELNNTSKEKILIFVCDIISGNDHNTIENIAKSTYNKKIILVTNHTSHEVLNQYFLHIDQIIYDRNKSLRDINKDSRKNILETARVVFQGKEVPLGVIIDNESLTYVQGDVLNSIINKETIEVGKPLGNANYDEIKHLYVDRRVKNVETKINILEAKDIIVGEVVNTLYDIADDVALVTGEPGIGKSTLLTHVSLKTKEVDPKVWIVRINLLEYSRELYNWKENKTTIDTLETLNFMCKVILREKLGKKHRVEIELEETNDVVYLKHCTGDQWTMFELKLFLHLYNRGKVIFLFDGFDEICPHYTKVVLKCLKSVSKHSRNHRMWVTSRSYNEVKIILQREFRTCYEIVYLSAYEREKYLKLFWETNLKLNELNSEQLKNIHDFIVFISKSEFLGWINAFKSPLPYIYINACCYLVNEIKCAHIPLWTYKDDFYKDYYRWEKFGWYLNYTNDGNGNPLHLYLTADFFQNNIKKISKDSAEWDLDINTLSFYERFLKTKLKTIRFQEKNKMDIYNPDVQIVFEKEFADFVKKHKQLAAFAIFNEHSHILFSAKEMQEIRATLKFIEEGGEKTGVIYSIENNIPIFIHLTFTEYFAVEYVWDLLKGENSGNRELILIDFVLNKMFSLYKCEYVRKIFDNKIRTDDTLTKIFENNTEVIFNMIMAQGSLHAEFYKNQVNISLEEYLLEEKDGGFWVFTAAITEDLPNILNLLIPILIKYINETNLDDFLDIIEYTMLLIKATTCDCVVNSFVSVLDIIRNIDKSKSDELLLNIFGSLLKQDILLKSSQEIYDYLCVNYVSRAHTYEQLSAPKYNL